MKRLLRKIKNFILKTITVLSVIAWVISACSLDSTCWVPFFLMLIFTSIWIVAFSYANNLFEEREYDEN